MQNLDLKENTILEEYENAKKKNRQPNCPFCGKPLEITQTQYTFIYWTWDADKRRYVKDDSRGDADKPYCMNCETKDWDFIDFDIVDF